MSSQYSIPVVDLNDYLHGDAEAKARFVEQTGKALRDVGFFALTHHLLSPSQITQTYALAESLFHLPIANKKSYEIEGWKGQRGYTSFGKEHAKDSQAPDLKEFWHVGQELPAATLEAIGYPANVWPEEIPEFKQALMDVYSKLEACALSILEACSLFLGEDENLIRDMAVDGNSILRLIHYPPVPADRHPASLRSAPHEDINLITLLIDATASGLEILNRQGEWIPVVTPPGCIIVDAGDMLQNLSNGFYKSTTHRVVNPNNSRERRYSAPFFVHARGEVDLSPLASALAATGGQQKYPNISAHDYLMQRLKEIGLA